MGERQVDSQATAPGSERRAPPVRSVPLIRWQKPMIGVLIAATPCALSGIYRFGWRSLAVIAVSIAAAFVTEWLFTRKRKEPVTSAVFVTAVLLALILPPTIPFWMVAVGAVVAIMFGKEFFGGFGRNVFNPALVGRCFLFVSFPLAMTGKWAVPATKGFGGFTFWQSPLAVMPDGVTMATPLMHWRTTGETIAQMDLLMGIRMGCIGETMALAILLGAAYLLARKIADWRLMLGPVIGLLLLSFFLNLIGAPRSAPPLWSALAGGFLFGAVFMVTDPVSAARTVPAKWIYGIMVGFLTVVMRRFGAFPEGMMFAILLMNTFVPALDVGVKAWQESRKPAPAEGAATP